MSESKFLPAWVHPSMRAEEQGRKRSVSLQRGEMDHIFHYQGLKQAELWLAVHRRHSPLYSDPSYAEIYRSACAQTAQTLAGRSVHVIGLGPGGGLKEGWLLEALQVCGCKLRYTPVDASLELAWMSAELAETYVKTEILPVVGDFSLLADLPAWLERFPADEIRLFSFFGTAQNFLPGHIFPRLRAVLREQDKLLMSVTLAPVSADDDSGPAYRAACDEILPQYNNPQTRQWLRQVLIDWGIAEDLSLPAFQVQSLGNLLGFVAASHWLSDVDFPWEGQAFRASRGEGLRLFFSLRYTPKKLAETLQAHGLILGSGNIAPSGQEGVWQVGRI
ncbi:MAG: L-histidine N(alpha)-methyltransferase [Methylococcaceae bacterium]|nr:L-histidine N(alpha)-methyltransferase [Methylococcaceae bacterium]